MRKIFTLGSAVSALALAGAAFAQSQLTTGLLQQPALSRNLIAFSYAGDIWTAPRAGGKATRLTTGVGTESAPIFSPDGQTLAFTGDYDGNIDVFTVPVAGGVPRRLTFHPSADSAVAWSTNGTAVIFRSNRAAASRYSQLFSTSVDGGAATALPLPMAFSGKLSSDGGLIAYTPLAPAFGFDFTNYIAWGNYRGGRAGTVWLTTLPGLVSTEIPHEAAADFSPVFIGDKVYFLSGRRGRIGVFAYDRASRSVSEVYRNTGTDIRSLATDGQTLIFDRLGELYMFDPGAPGSAPTKVEVDVAADLPDVRARLLNVADEVEHVAVSPSGLRAVVEAHGEILTLPAKRETGGASRNLTATPGVMEREPAWSPDGQSVAYFSDESGLYGLHVASQTGSGGAATAVVRKFKLAPEAAYYFQPVWSPDSKKIAFHDNRLHNYLLDLSTGALTTVGPSDVFGGFAQEAHAMAWSPDSRWLVYPHATANHMHVLMLYQMATGASTQLTDPMAESQDPAFDRSGKYLYFRASNNAGATLYGLDMSADLYQPSSSIYALALSRTTPAPAAPEADDEKSPAEAVAKARDAADVTPAGLAATAKADAKAHPKESVAGPITPLTTIDLAGMSVEAIAARVAPLPLPPNTYGSLQTGKTGTLYFLTAEPGQLFSEGPPTGTLSRWNQEDRKAEVLASHVQGYQITADGQKMLLALAAGPAPAGGPPPKPSYQIVAADKPVKAGASEGALSLDALQVRVDPAAEWAQMYREVWRIERAYFYDPNFHGVDTVAEERRLQPFAAAVRSRSDLNYVFQEMLSGFSVGHLRGFGGAIPAARKVPGGLLGADYEVRNGRWCVGKILSGGTWSPEVKGPLAQPGLNIAPGDCILAVNGEAISADVDIQRPLEGMAGRALSLTLAPAAGGAARDVTVVPVGSEARLRNLDWIEANRLKVAALSDGKLAYVYLPDTAEGGFTNFNRYYFAQTDKQGAIIDERFNGGGQVADYIIEVLGRKIESYWQPRYGAIEHSPAAGIYGPKVMIANEVSGSGGDAMPWLFQHNKLGPLVGKRTWGGLVGIGEIPVLMDGGQVTSPSVGFFSPAGEWDVENHGVEPDYAVEQDPAAVAAGHDPQLEKAVALAMEALAKTPSTAPRRPPFPIYGPSNP